MSSQIKHYRTSSGNEPVKEFIAELPEVTRLEVLILLRRLESGEMLFMPHSRSMASMARGLYELRLRDEQGQIRIFYYTKIKGSIFLVHVLRKQSQVITEHDRKVILKRLKELTSYHLK